MKTIKNKPKDVATYIDAFPPKTRKLLRQLRGLIKKHAPKADEGISYGMPGYKYLGMLVYFAGYEHHIGFYPGPGAIAAFKKEVKALVDANDKEYKISMDACRTSKGLKDY